MTSTGRIRPRTQTGLTRKNQRDMAKAIRRAIGIGLIPATYKHPQLLGRAVGIGSHGLY
jgi:small subunit ribosomal protein S18